MEAVDSVLNEKSWKFSRGIARSFVAIASDQEQLLESSDCWRPAKPGTRIPIANVPLKVLQAFTAKVDAREQRGRTNGESSGTKSKAQPKTLSKPHSSPCHYEVGEQLSTNEASDEESEVSVSSSQWPASPLEGALPPDSSEEENIAPKSWNPVGRKVSSENEEKSLSVERRYRCTAPESPTGFVKTRMPEYSFPGSSALPGTAMTIVIQPSRGDIAPSSIRSFGGASEVRRNVSLDRQEEDDHALDHCSAALSTLESPLGPNRMSPSSGMPTSDKTELLPHRLVDSHSQPLRSSNIIPGCPNAHRTDSLIPHSSTTGWDIGDTSVQPLKEISPARQSLRGYRCNPIEYPEFGLPTVQVDRTPDQAHNTMPASSARPKVSPPQYVKDKARPNYTAVPNTMQDELRQSPVAGARISDKSFDESMIRDGLHSSPLARPLSHVDMSPAMLEVRAERPKKKLKIHGDFAFASMYDSPEIISRTSRQDRREFLASCSVQSGKLPAKPEVLEFSLFDQFKQRYPAYGGDDKHFWKMCRRLEALHNEDKVEHPSLWDDYIVRNQNEYRTYLLQCAEDAMNPLPFDQFYRKEIAEPLFIGRVVIPSTLGRSLRAQEARTVPKESSLQSMPNSDDFDCSKVQTTRTAFMVEHNQEHGLKAHQGSSERKSQRSCRSLPWQQGSSTTVDLTLAEVSDGHRSPSTELPQLHIPLTRKHKVSDQHIFRLLPDQSGHTMADSPPSQVAKLQHPVGIETDSSGPELVLVEPAAWWRDPHTPFKEFVRADLAIRNGKGNAFAKPNTIVAEEVNKGRKKAREPRQWMDILSWTL